MPQVPQQLFQGWMHSFEEDEDSVRVYRPASHSFPMQRRPRTGLEFRADGTVIELRPGPADKRERSEGRWKAITPTQLRLSFPGGRGDRTVEIVHCDSNILKLRESL